MLRVSMLSTLSMLWCILSSYGWYELKERQNIDIFDNSDTAIYLLSSLFFCFMHFLLSFYYLYLLLKIKLFNFFKILKRRSTHLVLPSYVMKRKNLVSASLFILRGVKSVVSLTRNKLKMFLFLTRCCCLAFPILLYVCLRDVGVRFHLCTHTLEVSVDTPQSCGECSMQIGSMFGLSLMSVPCHSCSVNKL